LISKVTLGICTLKVRYLTKWRENTLISRLPRINLQNKIKTKNISATSTLRNRDRRSELFYELIGTGTKKESSGELIYYSAVEQLLLLGVVAVARLA
jgi:hypothetical protein